MENKKTTELMSRKSTLKSKLMAAVSMLLVSAIMVSVTTYAWFILSTAPEVKGMSTTVGSNGALEMALRTQQDITKITSSVGDSSAKQSVVDANKTWGNLVDLNDASYGLSGITMYPARLNWATGSTTNLASRNNLLAYAQYGTDGRIADLVAANAGTYVDGGFAANPDSYGVRAIGTAKEQAPAAAALETAQNSYRAAMNKANNNAIAALNEVAQTIADIAITHGTKEGAGEVYTKAQVNAISKALNGLYLASGTDEQKAETVVAKIEEALKWAVVAENASNGTIISIDDVTLDSTNANYTKLQTLIANIQEQQTAVANLGDKVSYEWNDISPIVTRLFNINTMEIGGTTSDALKTMSKVEKVNWYTKLKNPAQLDVKGGLFAEAADFVDEYTSSKTTVIVFEYEGEQFDPINAVIKINKTITENAYLKALQVTVDGYDFTGTGNKKPFIGDTYGYAVDLAFRSNAEGKLMLSKQATNRVNSDQTDTTLGGGCYFTANAGSDKNALKALRIAFVDDNQKVLAVGKLEIKDDNTTNKYPVHLYNYNVENGELKVSETAVQDDVILTLEANKAVALTAVVFMDGDATSFAQNQASGSLNLQFVTSTTLKAMDYTNYANAGLTLDANAVKTVAVDSAVNVPKVYLNGVEVTNVTWSCEPTDVVEINDGKITGKKAGVVKITANYTVGGKNHTASYDFTVTAN